MKVNKLLLFFLAIIFLAAAIVVSPYVKSKLDTAADLPLIPATEEFSAYQTIIYGGDRPEDSSQISVKNGESALDLILRSKSVETKDYSFGKLVESIEGVKNGTDNKYWIYSVNGEESKIGAADYKVKANDQILWEFKTYEE